MNGFALRLVLKQRHKGTWKWPNFVLLYNMFWKNISIPIKPEGNYNMVDVLFSNDEIFSPEKKLLNLCLNVQAI